MAKRSRDAPAAARTHLRALQRDDDAENALEYFCAPHARESGAFDFLCRLRRSGIARRRSAARAARRSRVARSKTSRRSRCAARSSSFNSARTPRANRSWIMSRSSRRKKSCSCMAIRRRWNGCARDCGRAAGVRSDRADARGGDRAVARSRLRRVLVRRIDHCNAIG